MLSLQEVHETKEGKRMTEPSLSLTSCTDSFGLGECPVTRSKRPSETEQGSLISVSKSCSQESAEPLKYSVFEGVKLAITAAAHRRSLGI